MFVVNRGLVVKWFFRVKRVHGVKGSLEVKIFLGVMTPVPPTERRLLGMTGVSSVCKFSSSMSALIFLSLMASRLCSCMFNMSQSLNMVRMCFWCLRAEVTFMDLKVSLESWVFELSAVLGESFFLVLFSTQHIASQR